MKNRNRYLKRIVCLLTITLILASCISYQYIGDSETVKREKEIQGTRVGNVIGDSFLTLASAVVAAFTGVYISYIPESQRLKHIALVNQSTDTLQVNMLTDQVWKDSTYCDFRDIRIPPGEKCRLLVPVNSVYNLYFSNTINSQEDDELLELNSTLKSKIILYPGMTFQNKKDTIINKTN